MERDQADQLIIIAERIAVALERLVAQAEKPDVPEGDEILQLTPETLERINEALLEHWAKRDR